LLRCAGSGIHIFLVFLFSLTASFADAQTNDSTVIGGKDAVVADTTTISSISPAPPIKDTVQKKKAAFQPKPKKAGMYSAILPGLGQAYNRQYWKLPIIYAGAAAAGYFFSYNLDKYHHYRKEYLDRLADPNAPIAPGEPYTGYQELKTLQDQYRKFLDMTALFSALGYTLQVIDAVAAAHLKNFDISRDISMNFTPVATPYYVGVGVVVTFK